MSWNFWSEHIAGEIAMVRRGSKKLVPVAELERWALANAERTLP